MAYTGNTLSLTASTIEGNNNQFVYLTTDAIATILGAGYFSDGASRGLNVGSSITVVNTATGKVVEVSVASLSAGAATVQLMATGYSATAFQQTITLPLQLADIAAGTFAIGVPFAFTLNSVLFRTAKAATTAAKLATLTAEIGGVSVTGGVMALTSANQNTIGGTVAGSAVTALNIGAAGSSIGVTASAVTAFIEGDGWVEFTVTNNDLTH